MPRDKVDKGWGRRKELLLRVFRKELTTPEAIARVKNTYGVEITYDHARKLIYKLKNQGKLKKQLQRDGERHARYVSQPVSPEDMKSFLEDWKAAVPEVLLEFQCTEGFLPRHFDIHIIDDGCGSPGWYCLKELELEKSRSFDCIGEYGKPGKMLMKRWNEFKEEMREFSEPKKELVDSIQKVVEKNLGLPFHKGGFFPEDKKPCFTWSYLLGLYNYVLDLAAKLEPAPQETIQGFRIYDLDPIPVGWLRKERLSTRLRNDIEFNSKLNLVLYQPYGVWTLVPALVPRNRKNNRSRNGTLDEQEFEQTLQACDPKKPKERLVILLLREQEWARREIMMELESDKFVQTGQKIIKQKRKLKVIHERLLQAFDNLIAGI